MMFSDVDAQGVIRAQIESHQREDHRHAGGAGHQDGQKRGDEAVAPGGENARRHHRRNAASVPHQDGQGGRAVQPQAVHGRVHQVADAREVADVFQNRQAHQKRQQVGQHNRHRSRRAQHRSLDAGKQRALRIHVLGQCRDQHVKKVEDAILAQLAHVENQPEESQEDSRQHRIAPNGMHGQAIHLLAPVGLGPGHARHPLKERQAGRMARRGDRRVGRLPGAQGDFRLRPLHEEGPSPGSEVRVESGVESATPSDGRILAGIALH